MLPSSRSQQKYIMGSTMQQAFTPHIETWRLGSEATTKDVPGPGLYCKQERGLGLARGPYPAGLQVEHQLPRKASCLLGAIKLSPFFLCFRWAVMYKIFADHLMLKIVQLESSCCAVLSRTVFFLSSGKAEKPLCTFWIHPCLKGKLPEPL